MDDKGSTRNSFIMSNKELCCSELFDIAIVLFLLFHILRIRMAVLRLLLPMIKELRHIAANILSLADNVSGVPSPSIKFTSFYYKTGLIWHNLCRFDIASSCFKKATDLLSNSNTAAAISADDVVKLLLDVNLTRSRTAWELSDRNLAVALLSRSKTLLLCFDHYSLLASQYLA
ncbi:hypothetical protein CMV_009444 [Castanea mollissima]|uniref:Uncharacterized protein n=1 Tax=Castanea mollissima TaxID=60419 RepID=A0A8J4RPB2_9ROSI|nr:hypothetical protein CMV_009444 [Castanea mollissima]